MTILFPKSQGQTASGNDFPHELLHQLGSTGELSILASLEGLDRVSREHMEEVNTKTKKQVVPLALWGDSVPFSWDKRQATEMWCVGLPGLPAGSHWKNMRVPLTSVPHDLLVPEKTMEELLDIFAKSMIVSMGGFFSNYSVGWPALLQGRFMEKKIGWNSFGGHWMHCGGQRRLEDAEGQVGVEKCHPYKATPQFREFLETLGSGSKFVWFWEADTATRNPCFLLFCFWVWAVLLGGLSALPGAPSCSWMAPMGPSHLLEM